MARRINFSSLTPAERLVFAGGLTLFISGFVPWWYRTATPDGTFTYNAGLTSWSLVAILGAALTVIVIMARASIWPDPAPSRDGMFYTALGVAILSVLSINLASAPGIWLGSYAALAFGSLLLFGALKRNDERRTGWS